MSEAGHAALSEAIAQSLQQARSTADVAISGLAEIAASLQLRESADLLREAREQLRSDTFRLIVMGSFKTGKSSLVNALLGASAWPVTVSAHKGPMVVDDVPATAMLTGVRYAEKPYVQAWRFDGKAEEWSFARYLRESTLDVDEQVNVQRFEAIKEFEIGYPARLCREGVIVYDSPGLNADTSRSMITLAAAGMCDAAIIVYRSDMPMGQSELEIAAHVVAGGARVFNVINLWNGRQVDDRMRESVWNRYVRDYLAGPAWHHQQLSIRDIYFVDAAQARDGLYDNDNDEDKVEASGLADFERALAKFLVRERHQVHLQKFATRADNMASGIEEHISQRQKALQLDREKAQAIEPHPSEDEGWNRSIAALTETAAAVAQHRLALQRALVIARQTG